MQWIGVITCAGFVFERVRTPSEFEHLVVYLDGNDDYQYVLPKLFDIRYVDYAQRVKIRKNGKFVDCFLNVVYGEPFIRRVHINNDENFNGILRERVGFLVRRTKCIAKKRLRFERKLSLFQWFWNWCKLLKDKMTPAMLEGLCRVCWTWSQFLHYKIKIP